MKTNQKLIKKLSLLLIVILAVSFSCSDEKINLEQDVALVTDDAIADYYYEDTDDLAGLVLLADEGANTGGGAASSRTITIQDPRFMCSGVVITLVMDPQSSPDVPKGEVTIDFGQGCTDLQGNVRNGIIKVQFVGKRFVNGSRVTTQFVNYSINDIQLEGTRVLTNISGSTPEVPKFRIELTNGSARWPDGTSAQREHCYVRTWIRATNPLNDSMVVEQCENKDVAATGINRQGREYSMAIIEPIIYKRGCQLAVKGIKKFTDLKTGKVVQVNYGDGECDRIITLNVDGNSRPVVVSKKN
ncbi:MAG: hypothetical protein MUE95_03165 [Cyclobacteriaceae bacterium]|nr:hypothetical protein [Cyclobacteriaceae bacterium]